MLLVVQFPFADLREFSTLRDSRTSKPNWSKLNFRGFVRGFGEVESRYHRLKNPEIRILYKKEKIEQNYVSCTKRVYPIFILEKLPSPWKKCLHIYTRIISDGRLSFRLEIGIHCEFIKQPNFLELKELIKFVLGSQLSCNQRRSESKKTYVHCEFGLIGQAESRIRSKIQEKTTLHSFGKDTEKKLTDFLDFLGLLVFADFSESSIHSSIIKNSQIIPSSSCDIELAFFEEEVLKKPLGIWVSGSKKEFISELQCSYADRKSYADKQRRVRLHILRFSSELRALETALSAAAKGSLDFGCGKSSIDTFKRMVGSSLDRLIETGNTSSEDLVELKVGKLANSEALFEVVEYIDYYIKQLNFFDYSTISSRLEGFKGNVGSMIIVNNPRERLDVVTKYVEGDVVSGDQFKGNKAGFVAKNVKSKNIMMNNTWNEFNKEDNFDFNVLKSDLISLAAAMSENAETEDQLDEVTLVKKAALAANKDERSKVLEHLGNVGRWTISIGEKIGVPIAVAVLKKVTGLG